MPLADRVFRRGVALERIVVVGSARFIEQQRPLNRDLARETQNSSATRDLISRAETSVRAEDASREERGESCTPSPRSVAMINQAGGRREGEGRRERVTILKTQSKQSFAISRAASPAARPSRRKRGGRGERKKRPRARAAAGALNYCATLPRAAREFNPTYCREKNSLRSVSRNRRASHPSPRHCFQRRAARRAINISIRISPVYFSARRMDFIKFANHSEWN